LKFIHANQNQRPAKILPPAPELMTVDLSHEKQNTLTFFIFQEIRKCLSENRKKKCIEDE
jgi:hypothetical protein